MIIKYWSNGHNYIDNVETVRTNHIENNELVEEAKSKMKAKLDFRANESKADNFYRTLMTYVQEKSISEICNEIGEIHNYFTKEQTETLFDCGACSLIVFKRAGRVQHEMLITYNPYEILNDEGKGIR